MVVKTYKGYNYIISRKGGKTMSKKASKLLSVLLIATLLFSIGPVSFAAVRPPVIQQDDLTITESSGTITLTAKHRSPDLIEWSHILTNGPGLTQLDITSNPLKNTNEATITFTNSSTDISTYILTAFLKDDPTINDTIILTFAQNTTPSNTPPIIDNQEFATPINTPISDKINFSDPDGDSVTMQQTPVSGPNNGVVTLSSNGDFTFTPTLNFIGSDSFVVKVIDSVGAEDTGTITIHVNAENNPPVAGDDEFTTEINTALTFNPLENDYDPDDDTLAITSVTQGSLGTVSIKRAGLKYTPQRGVEGEDTFTYTVSDGNGGEDTAYVTITIGTVINNEAPIIMDQTFATDEDIELQETILFTDDSDTTLDFTLQSDASHGYLSLNQNGTFSYTPDNNYFGSDSFVVVGTDSHGASDAATIAINVAAVNDDPVAVDDIYSNTLSIGDTVNIDVLANDSDIDGNPLSITNIIIPDESTLGSIDYTSSLITFTVASYGTEEYLYYISDGNGGIATGTLTITIIDPNPTTTANDDYYQLTFITTSTFDVTANDTGLDLTIVSVSTPTMGTASVNTDENKIVYTPMQVAYGDDVFTYTLIDGTQATITVNVEDSRLQYVILGDSIAVGHYYTSSDTASYAELFYTNYLSTFIGGALVDDFSLNGITSTGLLTMLTDNTDPYYFELQMALKDADVVTVAIGSNNIMRAAKQSDGSYDFTNANNINWELADQGLLDFDSDWEQIIAAINNPNMIENPDIMVSTLYNPYNYDSDPNSLHQRVHFYMTNTLGTGINDQINASIDLGYHVIDVYQHFYDNFRNNMGAVTHFYDLFGLIKDPHPNDNGHNEMYLLHKNYYDNHLLH